MIRKIIKIDADKCNGCGLCVLACHEGAIGLAGGKAVLLRDDYCDGLGDCLPVCPTGAITFEEREAAAYDEAAAPGKMREEQNPDSGCPGSRSRLMEMRPGRAPSVPAGEEIASALRQWPVQIKLAPVRAEHYQGADLLIAADCTAFAYAHLHDRFMRDRITLIGCPKLDAVDYAEKLAEILRHNEIKSIEVLRMEVPCCAGLARAVQTAVAGSGRVITYKVTVISVGGQILTQ